MKFRSWKIEIEPKKFSFNGNKWIYKVTFTFDEVSTIEYAYDQTKMEEIVQYGNIPKRKIPLLLTFVQEKLNKDVQWPVKEKVTIKGRDNFIFGYGRVSAPDQRLDIQIQALEEYGCDKIVTEKISGIIEEKELLKLRDELQEGDKLVVTRIDRLGRDAKQLIEFIYSLDQQGVNLIILDMNIDTKTPMGKFFIQIMASISELERSNLKEKQRKGIENRRKQGLHMGRKPQYKKPQMDEAVRQVQETDKVMKEICEATGVPRASLYRELKARGIKR